MDTGNALQRFLDAQNDDYTRALSEIKQGREQSHWMWYIFPQIQGLGFSSTARFYAIAGQEEAVAYLQHPILGSRLLEISKAMLTINGKSATQVLGTPDDLKLKSSMTLFGALPNTDPVFQDVLDKFYDGSQDERTLEILGK